VTRPLFRQIRRCGFWQVSADWHRIAAVLTCERRVWGLGVVWNGAFYSTAYLCLVVYVGPFVLTIARGGTVGE